jgi:hypothetical protein
MRPRLNGGTLCGGIVGGEMLSQWRWLSVLAFAACATGAGLLHYARQERTRELPRTREAAQASASTAAVAPSPSVAAPLASSLTTAPPAQAIRYEVVEAADDDPKGQKAGVFAKRDGATFTISAPWADIRGISVLVENDLDGDGLADALIESASLTSYVPLSYFFVAGTMGKRFVPQPIDTGVSLEVESWRGRPSAVIHSNNEGYNVDRPQSVSRRFVFQRGRAIKVDEQRAVELKALANLRARDFAGAAPDEERSVLFDLDGDGRKDAIVGTLWQRWGRILWRVRFADGGVAEGGESGCKRLGVLAETTGGHRDLVCDFDSRLKWNGQTYANPP